MFSSSQRTIFANDLANCQMFGVPYNFKQGTTLNNLLDILPTTNYPNNTYPTLRYFCLGNGGDSKTQGTSYPYSQHQAKDGGLFNMIPLVAKRLDQDLGDSERAKYRLRKVLTIGTDRYAFYFAKYIDLSKITISEDFYQISHTENSEDTADIITFDGRTDILKPTPINKVDIISSKTTTFITKLDKIYLELSENEVANCMEAIDLYYDGKYTNNNSKVITEVALCHGCDIVITDGVTLTESVGTQIAFHLGINLALAIDLTTNKAEGISKKIEIGGMEPLYVR